MNVPQLRFKGFSNNWNLFHIGDLTTIRRGASPRPISDPKWFDNHSNVGWLRISDVTEQNGKIYQIKQHISELGQEKTLVINSSHLILSIAATVGKPAINYISTGIHDGFVVFINPKFNINYMFYWLTKFEKNWRKYGQPGAQINLNSDIIRSQKVLLPSLAEQQKIGAFFEKIDQLIALNERKLSLLKKQKQGYLQKLFPQAEQTTPQLRFKGFNEEWHEKYLKDVVQYENGKGHEQNISQNGDYIVVNSKYISSNGKIKKFTSMPLEILNKNMIVFVLSDVPNGKALAKALIIDKDNKYTLNQRIAGLTVDKNYNVLFIYYLINRNSYFLRFNDGVSQTNMSKSDVLSFKFLIPDLSEQQKIGALFAKLDHLIDLQNHKLQLLQELKKGYLQKMFV